MLKRLNSPLTLAALLLVSLTAGAMQAQSAVQILGTGTQPPAGNVSAGQNNAVIMGFGLTRLIAGAISFTGATITVNATHTALAADFTSIKLARDLNTNGQIDAGEIIATTATFPAVFGAFTTAQPIPMQPTGNLYLVGVDVAAGATVGRIFSLRLQANADIVLNPVATGRAGAPITGNNQTVIAASTAEIDVQRPVGTSIATGATDNIGNVATGAATNFTWTVLNTTTTVATLNLTGTPRVNIPAISVNNCTATVTTQPAATVAAGASTTFIVSIQPTTAAAFGFGMFIANNDANENPYNVIVTGTGITAGPEMELTRGSAIAVGGTDTVTGATAGAASVLTYTISNIGTANLTFTLPIAAPGALTNCTASITTPPATPVTPAGNTTLVISVTPGAAGVFSCTVSISNNDSNENPYTWTISGTATGGAAPEMDVTRGATAVANAGTDALGTSVFGVAQTLTYTIANSGTAALNLTGSPSLVVATAGTNCTASVTTQPASATVAVSGSVTFVVTFTVSAAGAFNFTVSAANTDADENPYAWTASGTGAASLPEMDVTRSATAIADGGTDAIGNFVQAAATTVTYTITNSGTATLNITNPVTISGTTNCTVTITTAPGASVAAAGTTTLVLSVTPTTATAFSFNISIVSDDPNENPYDWTVNGAGVIGGGGNSNSGGDEGGCSTGENNSWILLAGVLALLAAVASKRRLAC